MCTHACVCVSLFVCGHQFAAHACALCMQLCIFLAWQDPSVTMVHHVSMQQALPCNRHYQANKNAVCVRAVIVAIIVSLKLTLRCTLVADRLARRVVMHTFSTLPCCVDAHVSPLNVRSADHGPVCNMLVYSTSDNVLY